MHSEKRCCARLWGWGRVGTSFDGVGSVWRGEQQAAAVLDEAGIGVCAMAAKGAAGEVAGRFPPMADSQIT